jgi:hypothetical protein
MKLNLPSDVSKTLTSAATPTATTSTTTASTAAVVADDGTDENGLYTSFLNTVLVNRPLFPGPTDLAATTTTTLAVTSSPLTKQSTTTSSISNIEDWYMKYMSKILESSTTEETPTASPTPSTTSTPTKSSSSVPLDLFEEGLNMEFQSSTTEDSLGIRNELQQILSSLPGSGIMMAAAAAAAANSPTAALMTCPSTCTCSCPSANAEQLTNLPDSQQVPVVVEDQESGKMPSIVLHQVDPNDENSKKKVNLDIALLPCARTATYQLSLALKLCKK